MFRFSIKLGKKTIVNDVKAWSESHFSIKFFQQTAMRIIKKKVPVLITLDRDWIIFFFIYILILGKLFDSQVFDW